METYQTSPSGYYALEVDLLCFFFGGGEHPSQRATLFVRDVLRAEMEMEIRWRSIGCILKGQYCADNETLDF